jgi:hypothetical protein
MTLYRAYIMTLDDHVRGPPTIIDASNDRGAVEEATRLLDGTAIEVWDEDRLVAHLEPTAGKVSLIV